MGEPTDPLRLPVAVAARRSWSTVSTVAPFSLAIAAGLWFFRATFRDDRLPGDVVDARWSVTVLEHWFDVWSGDAAIRDLGFYHPTTTTLGLSDPFLIEGQFHALARMAGLDPVPAWFLAHVVTFLIGALGVAALSRRVLKHPVQQCVLVVTTVLSYPMVVQMSRVQTYGFLWMAWIVWAIVGLHRPAGRKAARTSVIVLLVLPPLIALSAWYGLILGATVLLILATVTTLLSGFRPALAVTRRAVGTVVGSFRSPVVVAAGLGGLALWAFAVWIFLPSFQLLPKTRWAQVIELSPRWSDLLNASLSGGGVWSPLYDRYYGDLVKTGDTEMGFTPVLAVSLVVVAVVALRRLAVRPGPVTADAAVDGRGGTGPGVDQADTGQVVSPSEPEPAGGTTDSGSSRATYVHVLCCVLTILAVLALLVVDERGNSLYGALFTHIPLFGSMRSPFRVQILLYPLAVYAVLKLVEVRAETSRSVRRPALVAGAVSCVVGGVLLVEMHRPPNVHWTRDQVLAPALATLVDDVEDADCDVLLMDVENKTLSSFVRIQIDATVISMLADVPTVHGYGRAPPVGHPGWDAAPAELLTWLRRQGVDGPVCLVSPRGVEIDR